MPNDDSGAELVALLLADFANVREGLLNVVSAGLTRLGFQQFPGHMSVHLAMMVYLRPDQVNRVHELTISLSYPESAEAIARINAQFGASAERHPGEGLNVPLTVPLLGIPLPHDGQVDVHVSVNGQIGNTLSFWAFQV